VTILRSISRKPSAADAPTDFPFDIPVVRDLTTLDFPTPVTFLVGENGSGKSTVLEAIAVGADSIVVGGKDVSVDPTLEHARRLAGQLRFAWSKKTRRGFFLRAEDFFDFARRIDATNRDLEAIESDYEERLSGYGLGLAQGTVRGQRRALEERYGASPDARSHGESFLHLFGTRFVPGGLYLLDEPEAALSPQRQLSFLVMVHTMVTQASQFIIATHSPILMSYPGATILSLDASPVRRVAYDDVEQVSITRDFLKDPDAFLRRLL
jgi:predicted ATPase